MSKIGFVIRVSRDNRFTSITVVLNYKELEKSPLLLGEFLKVESGAYYPGQKRTFLGMVTKAYYAPIERDEYESDLALGHLNQEKLDDLARRRIDFLHYDIVLLGSYELKGSKYTFYPSTRTVPSLIDVQISPVPESELKALVNTSLKEDAFGAETSGHLIGLGWLRYGSEVSGERKGIEKLIDPKLFVGRRTGNFGKTGFGKSNENKIIVSLVAKYFPETAFLILDLNNEYAFQSSDSTAMGLVQAFQRLGIKDRIVVYTNRDHDLLKEKWQQYAGYFELRNVKVNFYHNPEIAVQLAYRRSQMIDGNPPQYLESAYAGIDDWKKVPNRIAYVYGALRDLGFEPPPMMTVSLGNESYSLKDNWSELKNKLSQQADKADKQDGARAFYNYRSRLAFLKSIHTPEDQASFIETVRTAIFDEKKIVIIDIPSLGDLAEFLSQRVVAELFAASFELQGKGSMANFILLIEEAHNLLNEKASIFYRVAKEGRKFGIGLIYSTQSPNSIPGEILSLTENFLVKHLSSEDDVYTLKKAKVTFDEPIAGFILSEPLIGVSYVYMEPYQPFVLSLQIKELEDVIRALEPA